MAPATFWYLQAFSIKEISAVIDYIVYMVYDLHVSGITAVPTRILDARWGTVCAYM